MDNKKIPAWLGFIIITIFISTIGMFIWKLAVEEPSDIVSTKATSKTVQILGHDRIDLLNGNWAIEDDECLTDDYKHVTYGLNRVIYTVGKNDNLWSILSRDLKQRSLAKPLMQDELVQVLTGLKNKVIAMSQSDLKGIGISSGDAGLLRFGDKINIGPLLLALQKDYQESGITLLKLQTSSTYKMNDKYVCWNNALLDGANPKTFIALHNGRAIDKNAAYADWKKLSNSYPDDLAREISYYSIDSGSVYYRWSYKIEGADIESFQLMNDYYAKDKNSVYFGNLKMQCVDPAAASTIVNGEYLLVGNHVYRRDKELPDANANRFIPINGTYSKDDEHVYYFERLLQGADPQTFQGVGSDYAKDKNHAYCNGLAIADADVDTFSDLPPMTFNAEDKNNTYKVCKPSPKQPH